MSGGDVVTVVVGRTSPLAKIWKADGTVEAFSNVKRFKVGGHDVAGITELHELLRDLAKKPGLAILREAFIGHEEAGALLLEQPDRAQFKDGEVPRRGGFFVDRPLHAIMIDVDKFPTPGGMQLPRDFEAAVLAFVATKLPACFHGRSFSAHLSGSAGHPSAAGKLKAHVWFWLETPHTSAELREWAKTVPDIDGAPYGAVQLHYTSNPVLAVKCQQVLVERGEA